MGSRWAREREYGEFRLTHARFPAGEVLEPHSHDRATFAVMLEGGFDLTIGGRRLDCRAGTVFTEPGGDRHANYVGSGGARVMVIQPSEDADFPGACARMLDGINHFESRALAELAGNLSSELAVPDDVAVLEARSLVFEMLAIATRLERERTLSGSPPGWLGRVEEQIHDRFREGLTLTDLAEVAGVHPAHLGRVFRKRFGTSPGRYIRRLRLSWARRRLESENDRLSDVALAAGFADQAHFTRAFKRVYGVPPGTYRRLHGR